MSGSETMLRELFRGLETTIHERLNLIEQVVRSTEKPKVPLYDNEFIRRIERLEELVVCQPADTSLLEERLSALEFAMTEVMRRLDTPAPAPSRAPVKEEEPEVIETNIVVDEEDEQVVEEQEEEVAQEEEEEELVEEEEEEELELEPFEWQDETYGKDSENQIYSLDEDGAANPTPVGKWNGRKIIFYKH